MSQTKSQDRGLRPPSPHPKWRGTGWGAFRGAEVFDIHFCVRSTPAVCQPGQDLLAARTAVLSPEQRQEVQTVRVCGQAFGVTTKPVGVMAGAVAKSWSFVMVMACVRRCKATQNFTGNSQPNGRSGLSEAKGRGRAGCVTVRQIQSGQSKSAVCLLSPPSGHCTADQPPQTPAWLLHCFLKRPVDDQTNPLVAAAAWQLKKWLRTAALFWLQLVRLLAANPSPLAAPFVTRERSSGPTT
jgi:hypothetical protein